MYLLAITQAGKFPYGTVRGGKFSNKLRSPVYRGWKWIRYKCPPSILNTNYSAVGAREIFRFQRITALALLY